jgi:hypothetical protein
LNNINIRLVTKHNTTSYARAALLFAEPLLSQLGVDPQGLNLSDGTWNLNHQEGFGVVSFLICKGVLPEEFARPYISNAVGLEDFPNAPAPYKRLPPHVLDPSYRLPSGHGLPDSRKPKLWNPLPFPEEPIPAGSGHPTVLRVAPPDAVYEYGARGKTILRVCRWEADTVGTHNKLILPEIFATPANSKAVARLVPAWPSDNIPLFLEDEIESRCADWVLIVEGEKSCLAARKKFPKLACTTFAGGLVGRTNWGGLAGRNVLILPDQDQHGLVLAQRVRQLVAAAGARVARVVNLPQGAPEGWDVADPLPKGWTPQTIEEAISAAAQGPVAMPDISLLMLARRPPEPFPIEAIPPQLRSTVDALAEASNTPLDYTAGPLLALANNLAGGKLDTLVREGWLEKGNLIWMGEIGDPSAGKSVAATPFVNGFEAIGLVLLEEHKRRLVEWQTDCMLTPKGQPKPPKPILELATIGNATIPAIIPILANQGCAITLFTDEAASTFSNLDAGYRGKGASDRPVFCKMYDANSEVYIRRTVSGGEPVRVPCMGMGIVGYLQPEPLAKAMGPGNIEDGLFDRFLFSWPEPAKPKAPDLAAISLELETAPDTIEQIMLRCFTFGRKLTQANERFTFRFSTAAATRFDAWRVHYIEESRRDNGQATAFQGKAPGQVVRLATAYQMLSWAIGDQEVPKAEISLETLEIAIDLRTNYFAAHRDRIDQDVNEPSPDKLARTLARWIVREKVKVINLNDLRRHVRLPGLRNADSILLAAKELQCAGWIPSNAYIPNPKDWRAEIPLELPLTSAIVAAIARV